MESDAPIDDAPTDHATANDASFDAALIAGAFAVAAERGWRKMSIAQAARQAGLTLDRARARFPARAVVLMRFGRQLDQAALKGVASEGPVRDRLFDMLMTRIDGLQANRAGMLALLKHLPTDPPLAIFLAAANVRSMGWMLEAVGISATGPRGRLHAKGLLGVWLWTLRAWQSDTSEDLSATMAALDKALDKADQAAAWLKGGGRAKPPAESGDANSDHEASPAPETHLAETPGSETLPQTSPPPDEPPAM